MCGDRLVRVRAHLFSWALCAALILVAIAAEAASAAQTTSPSNQVQVWNVNTAGMAIGPTTDYRNFVSYILNSARTPYFPDIITLQEAGYAAKDRASCTEFVGLIAYVSHHPYDCRETGMQGGDAVVYRTDRFTLDTTPVWPVEKIRATTGAMCLDSSTWRSIALRLRDTSGKLVSVGSFHFPTNGSNTDSDCAWDNMQGINGALPTADIKIAAGDANHEDAVPTDTSNHNTFSSWEYWYLHSNLRLSCTTGDLCFKDVMYQKAANALGTTANASVYSYMHTNEWSWSFGALTETPSNSDRRDYIWVKPQSVPVSFTSPTEPRTPRWVDAGTVPYSDHRGQGALLTYP
jgi:hypothetical protein